MLSVRWSKHTQSDILRIAAYWLDRDPERLPAVINAIWQRVNWLADGHQLLGNPVAGLPGHYRWYLERGYGYKLYYRIEGDPPEMISVIAIRHGREHPLKPSTLQRYAE